jgi:hypothetical protein
MTDETPSVSPDGPEEDKETAADETLGGYMKLHHRPPAFEGSDGCPYTVSVEVEQTADLLAPYSGFLVFPRWAETGVGILGHLETPFLLQGRTRAEVEAGLGALTLENVNDLLEEAIRHRSQGTQQC